MLLKIEIVEAKIDHNFELVKLSGSVMVDLLEIHFALYKRAPHEHLTCTSVKFLRTDVCMDQSFYNIA